MSILFLKMFPCRFSWLFQIKLYVAHMLLVDYDQTFVVIGQNNLMLLSVCLAIGYSLQIYWFFKILKGAIRVITKKND